MMILIVTILCNYMEGFQELNNSRAPGVMMEYLCVSKPLKILMLCIPFLNR